MRKLFLVLSLVLILASVVSAEENVTLVDSHDLPTLFGTSFVSISGMYTNDTSFFPNTFFIGSNFYDSIFLTNGTFGDYVNYSIPTPSYGGEIASNGSDFWVIDFSNDWVYHLDANFNNVTDGFSAIASPMNTYIGITANASNLFTTDIGTPVIFVLDMQGNQLYNITATLCASTYSITTIDGSMFWLLDETAIPTGDAIVQINFEGKTLSALGVRNVGDGIIGDGNLATFTTSDGVNFWIGHYGDDLVYHVRYYPSEVNVDPYTTVNLPQITSNVSRVVTGLNRTYLYCTWRIDGQGIEWDNMTTEICPDPRQTAIIDEDLTYYSRIDYAKIFWNPDTLNWELIEVGNAGVLQQEYNMDIPEPPMSLFQQIWNALVNLFKSIICGIFPDLGMCS